MEDELGRKLTLNSRIWGDSTQEPQKSQSWTLHPAGKRERGLLLSDGGRSPPSCRSKRQPSHLGRHGWSLRAPVSSSESLFSLWLFSDVKKFSKKHSMLLAWETRRCLGFISLLGRGKGSPSHWIRGRLPCIHWGSYRWDPKCLDMVKGRWVAWIASSSKFE